MWLILDYSPTKFNSDENSENGQIEILPRENAKPTTNLSYTCYEPRVWSKSTRETSSSKLKEEKQRGFYSQKINKKTNKNSPSITSRCFTHYRAQYKRSNYPLPRCCAQRNSWIAVVKPRLSLISRRLFSWHILRDTRVLDEFRGVARRRLLLRVSPARRAGDDHRHCLCGGGFCRRGGTAKHTHKIL